MSLTNPWGTQTPPKGWRFRQPQTNWEMPSPVSQTLSSAKGLLRKHRLANPAITAKHKLATADEALEDELIAYNAKLNNLMVGGLDGPKFPPRSPLSFGAGAAAAVNRAENLGSGVALVIDWLGNSLEPASSDLAAKRATVCAACPMNGRPDFIQRLEGWAAGGLKQLMEIQQDLALKTPDDDRLFHCQPCDCALKLKVWAKLDHILAHTKPRVMAALPEHCWIKKQDQP